MENMQAKKVVHYIPQTVNTAIGTADEFKQKRVVAYCRVSTKQEEQLNSYEVQVRYYTDRINKERDWTLVGIYADESIIYGEHKFSN